MLLSKASSFHVTLSQPTAPHPQPLNGTHTSCLGFSFYFYRYISVCMCRVLAAARRLFSYTIYKLSCNMCVLVRAAAAKSLPEQGSNPGPRHWECRVLATGATREVPFCGSLVFLLSPWLFVVPVNTCMRESSRERPSL